jgi:hypothetical protein
MYITRAFWTNKVGKTYESIWLRESYRDSDGKVKNRNILNLKDWPEEAIALLQASLNAKNSSSPARGRPHGSKNKCKLQHSNSIEAFYVRPEEIFIEQGPFSLFFPLLKNLASFPLSARITKPNSPCGKFALVSSSRAQDFQRYAWQIFMRRRL